MAQGLFHKAICQSGRAENMTKKEFNHITESASKRLTKGNNEN
jgi:carboxylesterase type B